MKGPSRLLSILLGIVGISLALGFFVPRFGQGLGNPSEQWLETQRREAKERQDVADKCRQPMPTGDMMLSSDPNPDAQKRAWDEAHKKWEPWMACDTAEELEAEAKAKP